MMRSARRMAALAGSLLLGLGGAASDDLRDHAMPPGIRPFAGSVALRYGQFDSVTYTWRSDIEAEGRPATILEGWVMQGEMRTAGDVATWSYRLANIGRDGLVRERGALRVRTDAWGGVQDAEVLTDRWARPDRAERFGADLMFDARHLVFPLCCCPRGPIRMGDVIALPRAVQTMPAPPPESDAMPVLPPEVTEASYAMRSVAAGIVDERGRRHLVIRHTGRASTKSADEDMLMSSSGYSLLDLQTCLPSRSVWKNAFEFSGAGPVKRLVTTHTNGLRF